MNKINNSPDNHELHQEKDALTPDLGGIAVGNSIKEALIDVRIMPKEREAHFVDIDSLPQLAIGCGDERCVCKGSLKGMESEEGNLEHFIRCYGGPFGLAHTLMLNRANVQTPNNKGLRESLSHHKSAVELVISRLEQSNIVPMLHSDNGSEKGNTFNPKGEPDVGCAFAKKLGVITDLMARDYVVTATEEFISSQDGDATEIDVIMDAKWRMVESGIDDNFNYNRADYRDLVDNVAVLDGPHMPAEDAALVLNYTDKVSRPAANDEAFYDVDVKQIAAILIDLFPEIDFDAKTLLASIELQSITTAHALALGTRKEGSNLEMLAIEVFGDRQHSLDDIQKLLDHNKAA